MMDRNVKIVNELSAKWQAIEWQEVLSQMSKNAFLNGQGFSGVDFSILFPKIGDSWSSFFQILGSTIKLENLSKQDYFPEDLSRVVSFEYANEKSVLAYDQSLQEVIAEMLSSHIGEDTLDIALEYLELRLLALLSKCFLIPSENKFLYSENESSEEVEIIASIKLNLSISGKSCALWFGLGKKLVDLISAYWIENYSSKSGLRVKKEDYLTLVLDEVEVKPSDLIDYARSGVLLDLDRPFPMIGSVRLNQKKIAQVELQSYEGNIVCHVKKLDLKSEVSSADSKLMIAQELSAASIKNLFEGYVFQLPNNNFNFIFNSEKISDIVLGEIENSLVIKVL